MYTHDLHQDVAVSASNTIRDAAWAPTWETGIAYLDQARLAQRAVRLDQADNVARWTMMVSTARRAHRKAVARYQGRRLLSLTSAACEAGIVPHVYADGMDVPRCADAQGRNRIASSLARLASGSTSISAWRMACYR